MILLFTKIGSKRLLILDYTYVINRNMFQNYTINENLINSYDLELMLNGTSSEYDLQPVYNVNGFIGIINDLPQICSAIYDTNAQPFVYTCSENIDITNNNISLKSPINLNNEIVLNPRAYDNTVFEMLSGTDNFAFRQNPIHRSAPIAILNSSTKACTFFGDCSVPNFYNKPSIGTLIPNMYDDAYIKNEIDTLFSNIYLSNYTKNELDDIDNELSTLILNTYTKTKIETKYFNKYHIFANVTSNHYDKAIIGSMIPDVSIFIPKQKSKQINLIKAISHPIITVR